MSRAPDWRGATVAILASGASLSEEQCHLVKAWRDVADAGERRCIAINTTFRLAPWADVLYACDAPWWQMHFSEVRSAFTGECWTQDERAWRQFRINWIEAVRMPGLGRTPGVIHEGGNGGYQAINFAYQAGAARIVLLGYDMHGTHWHGPHPMGLPNTAPYLFKHWLAAFEQLAIDLEAEGVVVRNCTNGGRLEWFQRAALAEELD